MIVITWDRFHHDCRILAEKVIASGKRYEKIVCITRGGVFVGGLLAHFIDMRNITTVALSLYDRPGDMRDAVIELSSPDLPPPGAKLLVVDDLLDSGRTFNYIRKKWGRMYDLDFAMLYDKGGGDDRPTFSASVLPNEWVEFPWEEGPLDGRPFAASS